MLEVTLRGTYILLVARANSYMYARDLDLTVTYACTAQPARSEKVTKQQVNHHLRKYREQARADPDGTKLKIL